MHVGTRLARSGRDRAGRSDLTSRWRRAQRDRSGSDGIPAGYQTDTGSPRRRPVNRLGHRSRHVRPESRPGPGRNGLNNEEAGTSGKTRREMTPRPEHERRTGWSPRARHEGTARPGPGTAPRPGRRPRRDRPCAHPRRSARVRHGSRRSSASRPDRSPSAMARRSEPPPRCHNAGLQRERPPLPLGSRRPTRGSGTPRRPARPDRRNF